MWPASAGRRRLSDFPAQVAFFPKAKPKGESAKVGTALYPGWLRVALLIGGVVSTWAVVLWSAALLF